MVGFGLYKYLMALQEPLLQRGKDVHIVFDFDTHIVYHESLKPSTSWAVLSCILPKNFICSCRTVFEELVHQRLTCALSLAMLVRLRWFYRYCTNRSTNHLYVTYLHVIMTNDCTHSYVMCDAILSVRFYHQKWLELFQILSSEGGNTNLFFPYLTLKEGIFF